MHLKSTTKKGNIFNIINSHTILDSARSLRVFGTNGKWDSVGKHKRRWRKRPDVIKINQKWLVYAYKGKCMIRSGVFCGI